MAYKYRDPNCECQVTFPEARRIWCDSCSADGPLPGSLADPDWEAKSEDPKVLREAARRIEDDFPEKARDLRGMAEIFEEGNA
jgi:hypothetical protein